MCNLWFHVPPGKSIPFAVYEVTNLLAISECVALCIMREKRAMHCATSCTVREDKNVASDDMILQRIYLKVIYCEKNSYLPNTKKINTKKKPITPVPAPQA